MELFKTEITAKEKRYRKTNDDTLIKIKIIEMFCLKVISFVANIIFKSTDL